VCVQAGRATAEREREAEAARADRDRLAAGYQRLLAGEKIEVECRALRPEGVPVHLQVVIMPSVDLNDRFNGHYCFTKDIGTRKQLEDEVHERADALARANEALQSALLHKDRFLANMSHELRTPLNAILGLTEALQEKVYGPLAPAQLKPLGVIVSSGQHLLSLISDVLDVAKIGAGTLKPEYETVDLAALCRECVGIVKPAAQPKQQRVGFAFDGQVTELQADSRRLKQILLNLLSNAVKFTPAGGRLAGVDISILASAPATPATCAEACAATGARWVMQST
jgi:signal transduction histidine kinase